MLARSDWFCIAGLVLRPLLASTLKVRSNDRAGRARILEPSKPRRRVANQRYCYLKVRDTRMCVCTRQVLQLFAK
jgi:hypothetical protein